MDTYTDSTYYIMSETIQCPIKALWNTACSLCVYSDVQFQMGSSLGVYSNTQFKIGMVISDVYSYICVSVNKPTVLF